jgi:hypothetical protein
MIELELIDEWDGWSGIAVPDDMTVEIQTDDTTAEMQISLLKLLELYGCILHQKPRKLTIGTGSSVEITDEDEYVRLTKYPIEVRTTFDALQQSLDRLLRQVFARKDEREGLEERGKAFRYAEKKLRENDLEYDVETLYQRLSNER